MDNTDLNFYEIVAELNAELFRKNQKLAEEYDFQYRTSGYYDAIYFSGILLWHSEYDDRQWYEDTADYEPLIPFIKKKYNDLVLSMVKSKFKLK